MARKKNSSISGRFSHFLDELKKNNKINQLEVSRRIGIKPNYLSEIKAGRAKNPKDWVLEKIEVEFGYRKEWLRSGEEPMMIESPAEIAYTESEQIAELKKELERKNRMIDYLLKKSDPLEDSEDCLDDGVISDIRDYPKKK